MLGESVAEKMRETGFEATTLKISVKDNELLSFERQMKLKRPTNLATEMVPAAMELFNRHYRWNKPVRALGIRGSDLVPDGAVYQVNMFEDEVIMRHLKGQGRSVKLRTAAAILLLRLWPKAASSRG